MNTPSTLPDLTGRPDVIFLVDRFYARVRKDHRLGAVFDDIARVDWRAHLPRLYDFWDTVLFDARSFRGNLIGAHARLVPGAGMDRELFDHWLTIFRHTVTEHFSGPQADLAVRCAEDMAAVIHNRIHGMSETQTPSPARAHPGE